MLLITGAAGFIGSCFVRRLSGSTPMCLVDKLTYAGTLKSIELALRRDDVEFHQLDICQREQMLQLMRRSQCRAVVHFAAETHVDRSIESPDAFVQTNVLGTSRLLSAAMAYWQELPPDRKTEFRFLHVSTDEVYGSAGDGQYFDERARMTPSSPYAASKAASNLLVASFVHTYQFPAVVANCSNCFGPFQYPEKLIPLMILNALDNAPLPVYGDGSQVRQWMYVERCAEALALLLRHARPGESYNVATGPELRNLDVVLRVAHLVAEETNRDPHEVTERIRLVPDRPGHDRRYAMDTTKFRQLTGWAPGDAFDDQLRATVRWYLDNSEWVNAVRHAARQRRGLGFKW